MSNAIGQTSCVRHRDQVRFFVMYEDFQDIGKGPHAEKIAGLLRILEVKTNEVIIANQVLAKEARDKGVPVPTISRWIEVSYNEFVKWSLGTIGRSSFQIADKEAEKLLFVKSRVRQRPSRPNDPSSPYVPYKEYLLVVENVQAALDGKELPITGENFERYGSGTPVENNTGGMLKTTGTPVENNRLEYKGNKQVNKQNKIEVVAPPSFSFVQNETTTTADHIDIKKVSEGETALQESNQKPPLVVPSHSKERGGAVDAAAESKQAEKLAEKRTQVYPEGVGEQQKQIVQWYCELTEVPHIRLTAAALECLSAIAADMQTKEDVQGLYTQAREDIAARKDAGNKTVYFANLKDSLFNWKQKQASLKPVQPEPEVNALLELRERRNNERKQALLEAARKKREAAEAQRRQA